MKPQRRASVFVGTSMLCALVLAGVCAHAQWARGQDEEGRRARLEVVQLTGLAELALSSNARWLRHPSQVEPAAALSDAPGALDVDPAGVGTAPPSFPGEGVRLEVRRP